jgi:hypothetical protein
MYIGVEKPSFERNSNGSIQTAYSRSNTVPPGRIFLNQRPVYDSTRHETCIGTKFMSLA